MKNLSVLALLAGICAQAAVFDVKTFGAKGDGKTLDRDSINRAIEAASAAGGGTVMFPAGTYVAASIRLRSNIAIQFDPGAVLEASPDASAFDAPEPNEFTQYQDFGHSHWRNSLIWGDGVENISITGPGLISGARGLTRGERGPNKTIALRLCRNVTLRDFSVLSAGHFAVLATGTDNLTIDNLRIDTNRDAIDIDSCRNVRISNVSANTPNDDAIVLKTSFSLGVFRPTELVTITNCFVSGYDVGSLLDGTYKRTVTRAPDRDGPTGRIKLGTESNGDFRNITISNIVFDRARGLAIESVDGSHIEDIAISNITMREVSNSPIFIRLGSRMRAPAGTPIGSIRRVSISNLVVSDADSRYASIISGIPGHDVEDVTLSNVRIVHRGGFTLDNVAKQPPELVNTFFFRATGGIPPREPFATPEREKEYPEPSMFGLVPASAFFIRHAKGVQLSNVRVTYLKDDRRPAVVLDQAVDIQLDRVDCAVPAGVPVLHIESAQQVDVRNSRGLADGRIARAEHKEM